jgi:hypothetical protein
MVSKIREGGISLSRKTAWIIMWILIFITSIFIQYKEYKPLVFGWMPFWFFFNVICCIIFLCFFSYLVLKVEPDYESEEGGFGE